MRCRPPHACIHLEKFMYPLALVSGAPHKAYIFRFNTPTNNTFPASGTHTCLILRGYPPLVPIHFWQKVRGLTPPLCSHIIRNVGSTPPTPEPVGVGDYFSHSCYKEIGDEHTNLSILFSPPDILEPVEQWPDPDWLIFKSGYTTLFTHVFFLFITRNGIPYYCNRQFTQGVYKIQRIFHFSILGMPAHINRGAGFTHSGLTWWVSEFAWGG